MAREEGGAPARRRRDSGPFIRTLAEQVAFCLKTLLGGALYRSYPNDWAVWREDAGAANGPALARALPGMFSRTALSTSSGPPR